MGLPLPSFSYDFYRATRIHSANYTVANCLSVRLSVTRRYSVNTAEHILKIFLPSQLQCPIILVLPYQTLWQYYDEDPIARASNATGVWKNHDFLPISRFISEMMQVWAIVTMEGNYETVHKLSSDAIFIFDDLEQSLPDQFSRSRHSLTLEYLNGSR